MGFFSKIKENITHGGVDIVIQSVDSIHIGDKTIPLTLSVTARDASHNVTNISATLMAMPIKLPKSIDSDPNQPQPSISPSVVAQGKYTEPFTISPGETKSFQLAIPLDSFTFTDNPWPQVGQLDNGQYAFSIQATANVEGILLDPQQDKPIQVLQPGQLESVITPTPEG